MLGMPTLLEFNSIEENIKFAKKNNLDFIELNYNMPYVRRDIKNLNTTMPLTIHFYDDLDLAIDEPIIINSYLNVFKQILIDSAHLNIISINVHLNVGPYTTIEGKKKYNYEYDDNFILRLENALLKMKEIAAIYNVELVIENIITPVFVLKAFSKLIENGFNITFDIGHDATYNLSFLEIVKNNLTAVKEIHFHDSFKSNCHLSLGKGELDLKQYYRLSKGKNVVLEVKESNALLESINYYRKLGELDE